MSEWAHLKQVISEAVMNVSAMIVIWATKVTLSSSGREVIRGRTGESNRNSAYSWFPGNTCRNDHDISPGQGLFETVIRRKETLDF